MLFRSGRFNNSGVYPSNILSIRLIPKVVGGISVWRPGIYGEVSSIDTRPTTAQTTFEGGVIDYSAYPYMERNGTALTAYGTAAPTASDWMVGDKVTNTTPTAGGFSGWVCVTAGTPGTWKTFGAITA